MFGFNKNKKRILIIGMPDLVLYCLLALKKNNKNIVGVLTSPTDDPTYIYMKDFLEDQKLLHIENNKNFKDPKLLEQIRALTPDIAFVCSYNFLLPKELYEIPKLGTINFHPSLLPNYRGANPYYHAMINKEKNTGVTMHYLDETFDTGDIIKQIKVPILPNDTMGSLFNRMNEATAKLCIETVNRLERNEKLPRTPQQKNVEFIKAPKIYADTDDVKIDWNKSIEDIELFIRALNPFFGAMSVCNGIEVKFWDTEIIYNNAASAVPAGSVCEITPHHIYIATKQGFLKTKVLGIDGQNYYEETSEIIKILELKKGNQFI